MLNLKPFLALFLVVLVQGCSGKALINQGSYREPGDEAAAVTIKNKFVNGGITLKHRSYFVSMIDSENLTFRNSVKLTSGAHNITIAVQFYEYDGCSELVCSHLGHQSTRFNFVAGTLYEVDG